MINRFQQQFDCLGSKAFFTLTTEKKQDYANKIFEELKNRTINFENRFSRFKTDSELTYINSHAGKKTNISKQMKDILAKSKELAELTNNLFNPFILPTLQKVGYMTSWTDNKISSPDFSDRKLHNASKLEMGDTWINIPKNSAIDLGGIGKGYLLDELAEYLDSKKLHGYWISLGGDIICSGLNINNVPWEINIASSIQADLLVDTILPKNIDKIAIATSGVTKRKGFHNNQNWHHIIDPMTNKPINNNILSVTVTANSATNADVLAKVILIDGVKLADSYNNEGFLSSYFIQSLDNNANLAIIKKEFK